MADYFIPTFGIGIAVGLLFSIPILKSDYNYNLGSTVKSSIEECEVKLPRDQNCIVIAIPEITKKGVENE